MVLGRRAARFQKPDFMMSEPINEEKLQALRDAAIRVYIKRQNPGEKSSEVNGVATAKEKDQTDDESGVHLLASVATELIITVDNQLPMAMDLRWSCQKKRTLVSGRNHHDFKGSNS